jgi:hypothetical protein
VDDVTAGVTEVAEVVPRAAGREVEVAEGAHEHEEAGADSVCERDHVGPLVQRGPFDLGVDGKEVDLAVVAECGDGQGAEPAPGEGVDQPGGEE